MTEHLGGPESPDKLRERQGRYERLEGGDRMFKIVDVASGAGVGSVGFWTKEWRDEEVYESRMSGEVFGVRTTRWAPAPRPAGSFQGRRTIYDWRVCDAVTAHDPSRVYPANSGSCSDLAVFAADQPSSDLAFWMGLSGISTANITVIRRPRTKDNGPEDRLAARRGADTGGRTGLRTK